MVKCKLQSHRFHFLVEARDDGSKNRGKIGAVFVQFCECDFEGIDEKKLSKDLATICNVASDSWMTEDGMTSYHWVTKTMAPGDVSSYVKGVEFCDNRGSNIIVPGTMDLSYADLFMKRFAKIDKSRKTKQTRERQYFHYDVHAHGWFEKLFAYNSPY